jgi:hypothetical protein
MAVEARIRVVEGHELAHGLPELPPARVSVKVAGNLALPISDERLANHVLVVGGIGQGKTSTICHLLAGIREEATEGDVIIVFDPKGDYYKAFYRTGDIVVNDPDPELGHDRDPWDVVDELRLGGFDVEELSNEIASTLFDETLRGSNQPVFPLAAKDLFASVLEYQLSDADATNASLKAFWNSGTVSHDLVRIVKELDRAAFANYVNTPGVTTQGVLLYASQVVNSLFVGPFKDPGHLSVRGAVRAKRGRCIFLEYDVASGKALAPVYKVLVDLAIKEALSRQRAPGRVFFVLDEFRLLPRLAHMDHGVNFGRSQGACFIVGMQNVSQVKEAYEDEAASILSGFQTVIAFRVTDDETRTFIKDIVGRNRKAIAVPSVGVRQPTEVVVEGYVVEDSSVWSLGVGEAIIFMRGVTEPFQIQLAPFVAG